MRPLRSNAGVLGALSRMALNPRRLGVLVGMLLIGTLLLGVSQPVQAQEGEALFVLLPVGARAVGMGQSVVAQTGGSEQVWWNPAGILGDSSRELAIHHSQTIVGQGNTLSLLLPTGHVGALAASINLLDLGAQTVTDESNVQLGTINPLDVAYVLTYAYAPSTYVTFGASVKHVEMRISCSGYCADVPVGGAKGNGGDLGALVHVRPIPLTIGFAATNLGIGAKGSKPGRLDLGANYRVQAVEKYTDQVQVYASAGVVATTGLDSASTRIGTDVVLDKTFHVRAGYIVDRANGSGASIGIGIETGRFVFDLARTFGGVSADTDHPPTYFSLRYLW